jgi:hypothetical protein
MKEQDIQIRIQLALSKRNAKIFRNNVGVGWQGKSYRRPSGDIVIENPRPLHAGLCVGSSDLIGWRSVVVTSDMVGKTVAIFTAVEVKQPKKKPTEVQRNFINVVLEAGGYAGVATSEDEALDILRIRPLPNE